MITEQELIDQAKAQVDTYILRQYDAAAAPISLLGLSPGQVYKKILAPLGYERGEMDSNGWQWDYWAYFTHADRPGLCLSGCGWDGSNCQLNWGEYEF